MMMVHQSVCAEAVLLASFVIVGQSNARTRVASLL